MNSEKNKMKTATSRLTGFAEDEEISGLTSPDVPEIVIHEVGSNDLSAEFDAKCVC